MNYSIYITNGTYNESIFFIHQQYEGLPIPLDLSTVDLSSHILTIFISAMVVSMCCCISVLLDKTSKHHNRLQYNRITPTDHQYSLSSTTATEIIYQRFNYNANLIHLTLIDFCGYKQIPDLNEINVWKSKYAHTSKHIKRKVVGVSFLLYIATVILVASLLFAMYSGVVFIVQNTEYVNKFSIPISCRYYEDDDICIVDHNMNEDLKEFVPDENALYDDFYTDIFYPYLVEHDESLNVSQLDDIGILLRISPQQQVNQWIYDKSVVLGSADMNGFLLLDDAVLKDSDVQFAYIEQDNEQCPCCGKCITRDEKNWIWCCQFCTFCVGFILFLSILIICIFTPYWFGCHGTIISEIMGELDKITQKIIDIDHEWNQM